MKREIIQTTPTQNIILQLCEREMLLLTVMLSILAVNAKCRNKREDVNDTMPIEHFRLQSLYPITLGSSYTSDCNEIVFNGEVIGIAENWTDYNVIDKNEILYLKNHTLYHRFLTNPSLDFPLAHSVECFSFDSIMRRTIWTTQEGKLLSSDNSTPPLIFACVRMIVFSDTFLVLHRNRTITLNWKPIVESAYSLPLIVPPSNSELCSVDFINKHTVIVSSITCIVIIIFRSLLNVGRSRIVNTRHIGRSLITSLRRAEEGGGNGLLDVHPKTRSGALGDPKLQTSRSLH